MRYNPLCVVACVLSVVFTSGLAAAGLENDADFKILANDGESQDEFGTAVSISGVLAIVGAPNDDDSGSNAGAAYIFRFNGITWTQEAKLLASDGGASDEFGISVAIRGDVALIGATGDDDYGSDSGAVYVFSYNGNEWNQTTKVGAKDLGSLDEFGISIALSDNYAVVGSYLDDEIANNCGAAYVYRTDTWSEVAKLLPLDSDAGSNDHYGMAVSIYDDVIVVGSRWYDGNGSNSGAAYVYRGSGNSWKEEVRLEADDAASSDHYGWSVAVDQDKILVGSRYDDDNGSASGSAYLYYFDGKVWDLNEKLTAADGSSSDYYGNAVAISGNMRVMAAPGSDDPTNSGKIYVDYTSNDGDTWLEAWRVIANDAAINDALGTSVAFDGTTVIAGAPFNDDDGSNSGAAYLAWPYVFFNDCNNNNIPDDLDIATLSADCNENDLPDECDISNGTSVDCNGNGIPDECEDDCNENDYPDDCDISDGISEDCQPDGIPDECQLEGNDCNGNLVPDDCELFHNDCNGNSIPDDCELVNNDCNGNLAPDECDIFDGTSEDCNDNDVPDECELVNNDVNENGIPDECDPDCNGNLIPDDFEIELGMVEDCNGNDVPDECDINPDWGGTSLDCNENLIPDECDIADGTSEDCQPNGIPDECDDECESLCEGDVTNDLVVDVGDLLAVIGDWGCTSDDCSGDANDDGVVNVTDMLLVVGNWGPCEDVP